MSNISYKFSPMVANESLNALFASAWSEHKERDFASSFHYCKLWVCAYESEKLVGFVKVIWDGGVHAFLLDTTVHADYQRQGIGTGLVQRAVNGSRQGGVEWLHVDYEPRLTSFYDRAGFKHSLAGILKL